MGQISMKTHRTPGSNLNGNLQFDRTVEEVRAKFADLSPAKLEALIDALPATIARHDATLADPGLYARDPKAFDRAMTAAAQARADLEAAEMEWLELEEKKSAMTG